MKRIYVGNLSFSWEEEDVRELFSTYGGVYRVDLINDRATGRPRGFGFVEMDSDNADAAIDALNGEEHGGRVLRINEAYVKGQEDDGEDSNSLPERSSNEAVEPLVEDAQQEPPPGTTEEKIRHKLTTETRKWNSRMTNSNSVSDEAVAKEMVHLIAELRKFLQV